MSDVKSPMTGTIVKLLAQIGSPVESGQQLALIESMKLEIPVESDASGVLKSYMVAEGDFIEEGSTIAVVE